MTDPPSNPPPAWLFWVAVFGPVLLFTLIRLGCEPYRSPWGG